MQMYEKKGQVTGTVSTIVILIVGVGVAVLVLIFVGSLGGQTYELIETDIESIANNVVVNESFAGNTITAATLAHADIQSGSVSVWNATGATKLAAANYTINYGVTPNTITLASGAVAENGTTLTIDYTWGNETVRDSIKNGILSSFNALEQTGNYVPIVILAVVVALVLTIVLGFGGLRGGAGGSSSAL